MVAPLVAYAAVSAVVSIGSALYSSSAQRSEGRRAQQYARYNAAQQRQWGQDQAWMSLFATQYNNAIRSKQAQTNARLSRAQVEYNIDVLRSVSLYNSLAIDEEIDSMYNASELSREMAHVEAAKAKGMVVANQGASGTLIGEGSNAEVEINMMAHEALVDLAMETDAKTRGAELLNAKAQGQWQTELAIVQQKYENELNIAGMISNANSQNSSAMINGVMEAWGAWKSGANSAQATLYGGQQVAANLNTRATQTMVKGFGSAVNTMASAKYQSLMLETK